MNRKIKKAIKRKSVVRLAENQVALLLDDSGALELCVPGQDRNGIMSKSAWTLSAVAAMLAGVLPCSENAARTITSEYEQLMAPKKDKENNSVEAESH